MGADDGAGGVGDAARVVPRRSQAGGSLASNGGAELDRSTRWLTKWTLPVLAALVPLACSPGLADSFDLPKLVLLEAGLAAALVALGHGAAANAGALRTLAGRAALALLGAHGLATILSVEPRTSLLGRYLVKQGLLTQGAYVAYFLLGASWIRTEVAFARVAAGVTLAATGASAYAAAQYAGINPLGWVTDEGRRAIGTVGHPNQLAELLVMAMPPTAWLVWRGRGLHRDGPAWCLVVQALVLALTQARAAWLTTLLLPALAAAVLACTRWRPWTPLPSRLRRGGRAGRRQRF